MPEKLENLKVEEFAHPEDVAAMNNLIKLPLISKILSAVEDKANKLYFRTETLGNCVRMTEDVAPRIYRIVREVCETLDYDKLPEIYSFHSFAMEVVPSGVNQPVLAIPDYILNCFDDAMLRFVIGRAITRMKSGYLKFYQAARLIINASGAVESVSEAVALAFVGWFRKSDLTADRGGLLACQNYRAAMTALFCKAGMPLQDAKNVPIEEYMKICQTGTSKLSKLGKGVQVLDNQQAWTNDRIMALFSWYAQGGYDDLLETYLD